MVITIEPDLEAALNNEAHKLEIAPEVLALHFLRQRFLPHTLVDEPRDEWERLLRQAATDCGVALSNEAVSSEGLYD
jgi:hypothetical protein